jgi:hypothetical protein
MKTINCDRFDAYLDGGLSVLMVTDQDMGIDTPGDLDGDAVLFRGVCYRARDREIYLDLFGNLDAPL